MSSHRTSTTVLAAESNFLVPNATILVELFAFLIMLWVLGRFVVPPVQRAITERQELIRAQFDEAREAKERAEAAEATYQRSLEETRARASQLREEARAQGRQIIDETRAKAQAEADRELAHGRQHLSTERDSLARELRVGVGELAVELAGRIIGESLTEEAREAGWVERFLADLDAPTTGEPAAATAGEIA